MTNYATDTFTDTDTTPLASHTPDFGSAWIDDVAGFTITSNEIDSPVFSSAFSSNSTSIPFADYAVTATVDFQAFPGASTKGVIGRYSGGLFGDGYYARWNAGSNYWELFKYVLGSFTQLATSAETITTPQMRVLTLDMAGSTIRVLVDSVELINVSDTDITATGLGGVWSDGGFLATITLDNFSIDSAAPGGGTTVVSGRGSFAALGREWLSIAISGRPAIISNGMAEPPNWYHVGMISWGTGNGAMTAYPVTRDLDLVHIPAAMDTIWYEFTAGVTATITELMAP